RERYRAARTVLPGVRAQAAAGPHAPDNPPPLLFGPLPRLKWGWRVHQSSGLASRPCGRGRNDGIVTVSEENTGATHDRRSACRGADSPVRDALLPPGALRDRGEPLYLRVVARTRTAVPGRTGSGFRPSDADQRNTAGRLQRSGNALSGNDTHAAGPLYQAARGREPAQLVRSRRGDLLRDGGRGREPQRGRRDRMGRRRRVL